MALVPYLQCMGSRRWGLCYVKWQHNKTAWNSWDHWCEWRRNTSSMNDETSSGRKGRGGERYRLGQVNSIGRKRCLPLRLATILQFDWCCFYYFVRNSPVALLEALCTVLRFRWDWMGSRLHVMPVVFSTFNNMHLQSNYALAIISLCSN